MASMMQMGGEASSNRRSPSARSLADVTRGFAAFRGRAEIDHAQSLAALIESEIIPRLVAAHLTDDPALPSLGGGAIDQSEIEALAPLALQVEADALLAHVERILARGVSVETVMVDLLAPTARRLGEYWEEDRCDFIDVTMGLWRLQEVVHEIARGASGGRFLAAGGYRALFASMPGDRHDFGTVVIDELFRSNGWVTDRISDAETSDLLKCVSDGWFDMVGLTISCDSHIANLSSIIFALRNVSKNSRICVMVGGRIFSANPELAMQVGADGTARDAKLALDVAVALVREREREAAVCS